MQVTQTQRTALTCNGDGRRSTTGKTYIDIGLGLQAIGNPKNIDYLNKLRINIYFDYFFFYYWYIMEYIQKMKVENTMAYNKFENLLRWTSCKLKLQDKFDRNNQRNVKFPRGSVYACYLGENIGHEKSRLEARPCVVVSNNRINYKSTNIIVVPLSKEIKYKLNSSNELKYEWHYVLRHSKYDSLRFDSVVQCEDIRSISKARVGRYICQLKNDDVDEIRKRIKKTLQI